MNYLKSLFSSDPSASFGRVLSIAAFIVFIIFSLLLLTNPWGMIKVATYAETILRDLFLMVSLGYGITSSKEAIDLFRKVIGSGGTSDSSKTPDTDPTPPTA